MAKGKKEENLIELKGDLISQSTNDGKLIFRADDSLAAIIGTRKFTLPGTIFTNRDMLEPSLFKLSGKVVITIEAAPTETRLNDEKVRKEAYEKTMNTYKELRDENLDDDGEDKEPETTKPKKAS